MTFDRSVRYPTKWLPPTGSFPLGVPKNSTTETSRDGSPFEKDFISDTEGFFQGLMDKSGLAPSGNPDTALISDYINSLYGITTMRVDSIQAFAGLSNIIFTDGMKIDLTSWHPGWAAKLAPPVGGGTLYYDENRPKADHDGGLVYSPTVPFGTTDDYLNAVGETDGAGIGCFIRKIDGVINVQYYGALGDKISDDTLPFKKSFAGADPGELVLVPRTDGFYLVGDAILPLGVNMTGNSRRRIYQPFSTTDIEGSGAIVYNTSYAHGLNFAGSSNVSNLNFYGVDKLTHGVSQLVKITNMYFSNCSMIKYDRGFGSANTLNVCWFDNCHAVGNIVGMMNLVDSHVTQAEINANDIGISEQTGANDTTFLGVKNEWNNDENWSFFESNNCQVIGGVTDRAGNAGFKITNSKLVIDGVDTRRNGRNILGQDQCAHYFVEGPQSVVVIDGMLTSVGADDDLTGDTTPNFTVSLRGTAPGSLSIVGGDATGAVTQPYTAFADATVSNISNVVGIDDLVNTGFFKKDEGRRFNQVEKTATLANTASEVLSFTDVVLLTFSRQPRKLLMSYRNTSTGFEGAGELVFLRKRESGGSSEVIYEAFFESSVNTFGDSGSDDVEITFSNIATDFSSYDITVKNNSGSSLQIRLEVS